VGWSASIQVTKVALPEQQLNVVSFSGDVTSGDGCWFRPI
jgi:hypothetical protein